MDTLIIALIMIGLLGAGGWATIVHIKLTTYQNRIESLESRLDKLIVALYQLADKFEGKH